jgi:hypothetical protein
VRDDRVAVSLGLETVRPLETAVAREMMTGEDETTVADETIDHAHLAGSAAVQDYATDVSEAAHQGREGIGPALVRRGVTVATEADLGEAEPIDMNAVDQRDESVLDHGRDATIGTEKGTGIELVPEVGTGEHAHGQDQDAEKDRGLVMFVLRQTVTPLEPAAVLLLGAEAVNDLATGIKTVVATNESAEVADRVLAAARQHVFLYQWTEKI